MVGLRHGWLAVLRYGGYVALYFDRRLGGLLFPLLASCLLHALVIFSPCFGRAIGMQGAAGIGEHLRRAALSVTLSNPVTVAKSAPVMGRMNRPALEREVDGARFPAKNSDEGASSVDSAEMQSLLPLPGVNFYPTNELTIKPKALDEAMLDSEDTVAIMASGRIVLMLWINDQGEVVDVSVEDSDLPEIFSEAATKAFRKLHFSPGELNGKKVGAVMRVEVRYDDVRIPAEP